MLLQAAIGTEIGLEIDGEDEIDEEDGVVAKRDVVADAGYHQKNELEMLVCTGHRPVIPAPSNKALPDAEKEPELYAAALASREACGSEEGKELLKARAEKVSAAASSPK